MNKRQAKKRRQREVWIDCSAGAYKLPFLMNWEQAKEAQKIKKNLKKYGIHCMLKEVEGKRYNYIQIGNHYFSTERNYNEN